MNNSIEQKLIESEERYRRITLGLTDYLYTVLVKDGQAVETIHNNACAAVTGYTAKEFADDPFLWINIIVPEEREFVAGRFLNILAGNDIPEIEHRIICKEGKIKWVSDIIIPKYDLDGTLISYDGVIKDITERKKIENELLSKDTLLNLTGSTAKVGGWEFDAETLKQKWTEEVYRIHEVDFNFDPNVSKGIIFYAQNSRPIIENAINKAIELGEPYDLELEFITAKGNKKWVHSIGKVLKENEKTKTVYGSIQDITERKLTEETVRESEERFKRVFQNSATGMVVVSPNLKFIHANNALCQMIGYTESELKEKTFQDVTLPEDREIGGEQVVKLLTGEMETFQLEKRYVHKNGKTIWGSVNASVIRDSYKKPIHLITQIQDITDRKLNEDALRFTQFIVDHSADSVMWFEKETGKMIYTNKSACLMLGYSESEMLCLTAFEIDPSIPVKDWQLNFEVLRDQKSIRFESTQKMKNGTMIPVEVTANYVEFGGKVYNCAIVRNISERKVTEEALRESEAKYQMVFENSGTSNSIFDTECRLILQNKLSIETLGIPNNEAIGKNVFEVFGPKVGAAVEGRMKRVMKTCISESFETEFNLATGKKWFRSAYQPLVDKNNIVFGVQIISQDITERKLAEGALQKNEEKYRSIFENVQDVYYETSLEGIILEVSPSIELISKSLYKRTDLIGKSMNEFYFNSDDREAIIEAMHREGKVNDSVIRLKNKDGSIILCSISSKMVYDALGKPLKIIGSMHDITERWKAEEAIKVNEEKFRLLFENSPLGISITSPNGKILDLNKAMVDLLGSPSIEISKQINVLSFSNLVENGYALEFMRCVTEEKVIEKELQYTSKWGKQLFIFVYLIPLKDMNGNVNQIYTLVEDITERKVVENKLRESEEKNRALIEQASDGIFIADQNSNYIEVNMIGCNMLGYTRAEILKLNMKDLLIEEERKTLPKHIEKMKTHQVAITERLLKRKDGKLIAVEISGKMLEDGRFLGIVRDITERKRTEQELSVYRNNLEELVAARTEELDMVNDSLKRQIEKEKEFELMLQESLEKEKELSELKSRFISTTSHEFRTPLTSILSSAGLLKRYSDNWKVEKRTEHLDRIQNSVSYLVKLLDDLLTLSRTETGSTVYQPESINLRELIEECSQDAKAILTNKHQLVMNFRPEQFNFFLDRKLMSFILNNLLSNAVKYSPNGGSIDLNIMNDEKNLIIEVSDEGIGIPSVETGKIFESFYRSKNAENISGTGLGLAIVQRAVDLHKGNISVKSELGRKTIFTIKIPVATSIVQK